MQFFRKNFLLKNFHTTEEQENPGILAILLGFYYKIALIITDDILEALIEVITIWITHISPLL